MKRGPQRKEFGCRCGFPGFYRVFLSTTSLESYLWGQRSIPKRFSFVGGGSVRFFLPWRWHWKSGTCTELSEIDFQFVANLRVNFAYPSCDARDEAPAIVSRKCGSQFATHFCVLLTLLSKERTWRTHRKESKDSVGPRTSSSSFLPFFASLFRISFRV